jgi:hypothetical protein
MLKVTLMLIKARKLTQAELISGRR